MLAHIFKGQKTGTYVDVGCNHPVVYSNTWLLYKQGWQGLAIDPHAQFQALFSKKRPRDQFINLAIDAECGEKSFLIAKDSRMSSLENKDQPLSNQPQIIGKNTVKTAPLTTLLQKYSIPQRFEFLNIDVEGHELSVLKSLDLNLFRPRLILVEIHNLQFECIQENPIVCYLKQWNYQLSSYAIMNGYFVEG